MKWLAVLIVAVGVLVYSQPVLFEHLLLQTAFRGRLFWLQTVQKASDQGAYTVEAQALDSLLDALPLTIDDGFPDSYRKQGQRMRATNWFSSSETRVRPDLVSKDARSKSYLAAWVDMFGVHSPITLPHILYLHGGGYVFGDADCYAGFVSKLIHGVGARALLPNYALLPEHSLADALEDAVAAYQHVLKAGAQPRQVVVVGDSAGGNLAVMTLLALKQRGLPMPAGLVLLSPWTDLTLATSATVSGEHDHVIRRAEVHRLAQRIFATENATAYSPALMPPQSFAGFPRTLVLYSTTELLANDARVIVDHLRAARVPVTVVEEPAVPHVWPIFSDFLPQAQQAIATISRFIYSATGGRRV